MEIITEITQRNQYKQPCRCASYVRMRDTVPFCDDRKSPYYLRCPAGQCERKFCGEREELLQLRSKETMEAEARVADRQKRRERERNIAEAKRAAAILEESGCE